MKKRIIILAPCLLSIIIYLSVCTAVLNFRPRLPSADSCFLITHWQQMGGFEKYTPEHMRLGCWSTALAQIVYYHRLKPFGRVNYTSSKCYLIDEQIDSSKIDFSKIRMRDPNDVTAWYNYDAALAVNKDFGTDHYMHKLAPASLLESHYAIKAARYICWHGLVPYTTGKLEAIITNEIHVKRPLFLHFTDLTGFGHSVVVDGYKFINGHFLVHLNQGQGGPQDGWYDFEKDLLHPGDRNLRVIYTIRPKNSSILIPTSASGE